MKTIWGCFLFFVDKFLKTTNKKPLLMGKKEGKNNIKIMKKIRLYFFSMPQHRKVMQR